ncbi:MAG: ABC transporter ATP-binding protein [Lachnospiraceae bacterium]|nr:ABC transporter ATP-binding protein [Lachnospiraceae bacterium]
MKKLGAYMKRFWFLYLLGFAGMVISIALDMMSPQITKRIIDDVIVSGQTQLLMRLLLGLLGIGIGRAIFQYIKEFSYDYIGVSVGYHMRKDLFRHIQSMSMDFFDRHNTGELMTRIKEDTDKVWVAVGFIGILAVEAVTHTILVLIFMFRLNPLLTLIPLLLLPAIGFCALRMEKGLGSVYDELSEETAKINTVAQECFAGVRTVKAFARESYEIEKFSRHNQRFYDLNMEQAKLVAKYQPRITFLGKVMLLSVVIAGGLLVISGRMTLGDLGAFSEYANNVIWPMEIVGWLSNDIASAFASWKKMKKVAGQQAQITEPEDAKPLENVKGDICFENVSFSLEGHEILRDVCFHLKPGQTLGIMGMTGTGKTTVVNLLQRFYDVTEGRILLDGRDIRELPLAQLRASMAVVMQEVFLFSDSVTENVRTGRREALGQDTVEWAAKKAGAAEFISGLGSQYETIIGERGVGLSGGQKQRISIARAVAKRAPVLILDDATSALDMETEQLIQKNLDELQDSSKIIIGHRISAVRSADEIIILDGGTVAERGTHEELMQKKGYYYRTWRVQYGEACEPARETETLVQERKRIVHKCTESQTMCGKKQEENKEKNQEENVSAQDPAEDVEKCRKGGEAQWQ